MSIIDTQLRKIEQVNNSAIEVIGSQLQTQYSDKVFYMYCWLLGNVNRIYDIMYKLVPDEHNFIDRKFL